MTTIPTWFVIGLVAVDFIALAGWGWTIIQSVKRCKKFYGMGVRDEHNLAVRAAMDKAKKRSKKKVKR